MDIGAFMVDYKKIDILREQGPISAGEVSLGKHPIKNTSPL